jgi:hypothetical protein
MRTIKVLALLAAGSLGLAACGAQATIDQAVASLGGSPYLQVQFTGSSASASPAGAPVAAALKDLSVTVDLASTNGANLSSAGTNYDSEAVIALSGTTVLDVRSIGGDLYAEIDLAPLAGLPGLGVSAGQLSAANLLLGGKWFEVPQSLLQALSAAHQPTASQVAQEKALESKVVDALTALVDNAPYTSANGTFSESGTLQSVVNALAPIFSSSSAVATSPVTGTYTVSLSTSGASATGGTVTITSSGPAGAPTSSPETVTVNASVSHNTLAVATPSNPVIVTKSMLGQLSSLGG